MKKIYFPTWAKLWLENSSKSSFIQIIQSSKTRYRPFRIKSIFDGRRSTLISQRCRLLWIIWSLKWVPVNLVAQRCLLLQSAGPFLQLVCFKSCRDVSGYVHVYASKCIFLFMFVACCADVQTIVLLFRSLKPLLVLHFLFIIVSQTYFVYLLVENLSSAG